MEVIFIATNVKYKNSSVWIDHLPDVGNMVSKQTITLNKDH